MSEHQGPVEVTTEAEARERIIVLVAELCKDDSCLVGPVLEQYVSDAVADRWEGNVSNYVPILAFREAQECIRLGYCPKRSGDTA